MDPKWLRNSFIYLLVLVAVVAVFFTIFPPTGTNSRDVDITEVLVMARSGEIQRIEVQGETLLVQKTNGDKVRSRKEPSASVFEVLEQGGVDLSQNTIQVVVREPSQFGNIFGLLINFLPLIFFGAVLIFMMRQAQGTNNQALSFGKSRARLFTGNRPTVTFDDVAGVDEPKQELEEVVEFLKYPEKFSALGARIPAAYSWWDRPAPARPSSAGR